MSRCRGSLHLHHTNLKRKRTLLGAPGLATRTKKLLVLGAVLLGARKLLGTIASYLGRRKNSSWTRQSFVKVLRRCGSHAATNREAMAFNLTAMASNPIAMASSLLVMASNLLASDGLINSNGLQPNSELPSEWR